MSVNNHWKNIWNEYQIEQKINQQGFFDIRSDLINKYHQSRLMCKIDFRENIPEVFLNNKASILAIENGKYRIARTDPFININ